MWSKCGSPPPAAAHALCARYSRARCSTRLLVGRGEATRQAKTYQDRVGGVIVMDTDIQIFFGPALARGNYAEVALFLALAVPRGSRCPIIFMRKHPQNWQFFWAFSGILRLVTTRSTTPVIVTWFTSTRSPLSREPWCSTPARRAPPLPRVSIHRQTP